MILRKRKVKEKKRDPIKGPIQDLRQVVISPRKDVLHSSSQRVHTERLQAEDATEMGIPHPTRQVCPVSRHSRGRCHAKWVPKEKTNSKNTPKNQNKPKQRKKHLAS